MTDDIRRLLGGYATGTLTEEERQALFAAALEDQSLFEALADEQVLKDLLEDGVARAQLLQATETARFSFGGVLREWFDRPKAKVLVAAGAVLIGVIGVREINERRPALEEPQTVAVLRDAPPPPPAAAAPQAARLKAVEPARKPLRRAESNAVPAAVRSAQTSELRASTAASEVRVAPDSATRIASAGDLQMKYTVLLRNPAGNFTPVPVDHVFAPGDRARVRVEVNQEGMISLTGADRKPIHILNVAPGAPTVIPHEIDFEQPGTQEIEIAFLKTAPVPLVDSSPVMQFSERKMADQAAAAPRAKAMEAGAPAPTPSSPTASVAVRLQLQRKP